MPEEVASMRKCGGGALPCGAGSAALACPEVSAPPGSSLLNPGGGALPFDGGAFDVGRAFTCTVVVAGASPGGAAFNTGFRAGSADSTKGGGGAFAHGLGGSSAKLKCCGTEVLA